jgi:hypothetical protein
MIFAESDEKSVIVCGICGKSKKPNFLHRRFSPVVDRLNALGGFSI